MICEKCGKVNNKNANRCTGCGFSFEEKRAKRRKESIVVSLILSLLVAFTTGLGFVVLPDVGGGGFLGGGGGGGGGSTIVADADIVTIALAACTPLKWHATNISKNLCPIVSRKRLLALKKNKEEINKDRHL